MSHIRPLWGLGLSLKGLLSSALRRHLRPGIKVFALCAGYAHTRARLRNPLQDFCLPEEGGWDHVYFTKELLMIKNRPPVPQILAERAKYLRSHMTPEERHLWYDFLRTCGYKFNRQYVIGNYIVDFYSPRLKLIIEVDGRQHYDEEARKYDEKRTAYAESFGLSVFRITNEQIHKNFPACCTIIKNMMEERYHLILSEDRKY